MGPIDDHHAALGGDGGVLGAPTGPELSTPDGIGRFRHYLRGSVYWSPVTQAHEVHGAIVAAWSGMGWERSPLGYPLTDELAPRTGSGASTSSRTARSTGPRARGRSRSAAPSTCCGHSSAPSAARWGIR